MVGAGGGEEQGLGLGGPAVVVALEQKLADRLGAGAAAGLAGLDHLEAAAAQRLGQRLQLGRLADPLPAFEGDEAARASRLSRTARSGPFQIRPKKPASPTASAATSGMVWGGVSAVETTRSAICWPLAIGALIGPLIDDLGADVPAERRPDRVTAMLRGATRPTLSSLAELDLGLGDLLALAEQGLRLPGAEAPVHELDRFLDPLVEAAEAGDDHDDPAAVLLGRAGEAVARLLGMAGLEAVGALRPGRAADCGCPG